MNQDYLECILSPFSGIRSLHRWALEHDAEGALLTILCTHLASLWSREVEVTIWFIDPARPDGEPRGPADFMIEVAWTNKRKGYRRQDRTVYRWHEMVGEEKKGNWFGSKERTNYYRKSGLFGGYVIRMPEEWGRSMEGGA
jgi:hypothetical protein